MIDYQPQPLRENNYQYPQNYYTSQLKVKPASSQYVNKTIYLQTEPNQDSINYSYNLESIDELSKVSQI